MWAWLLASGVKLDEIGDYDIKAGLWHGPGHGRAWRAPVSANIGPVSDKYFFSLVLQEGQGCTKPRVQASRDSSV